MTKYLNISTDTTLGGNSPADDVVVSQKAIKTYVDNQGGGGTTYTAGTGIDITNDVISVKTPTLTNTATGTAGLTIGGTAATLNQAINIGNSSVASGNRSVALGVTTEAAVRCVAVGNNAKATTNYAIGIGNNANASGISSIAIGYASVASAQGAVQISATSSGGTNGDPDTVKISNSNGNFEIMSADGTIPAARHADTTSAAEGQVLTLDSNLKPQWAAGGGGGDIDCGTMS